MVPVMGKDVLGLDPVEVGLLAGAEGAGAFVGSMFLAVFARPRWFLTIYTYGTLLALDHGVEFLRGAFLNVPGSIPLRVNLRSQRRRLRRELSLCE